MTDVRKVLTSLVPQSSGTANLATLRNQYKTPHSDHPVRHNSNGLLELDHSPIHCPHNFINSGTLDFYLAESFESSFNSGYLSGNITLHPAFLSPYRKFLFFADGSDRTWTLPDPDVFLNYLRNAFPDLLAGGVSWDMTIFNNSTLPTTLTVLAPPPSGTGTVGRFGFNNGNSHNLTQYTSALLTLVVINSNSGSENVQYIFS